MFYSNIKGLLQNLTRQTTAPSYFVFITHLKDASRLKGVICGNPGLQAGGMWTKTSRLKDGTSGEESLSAGVHGCDIGTIPKRRLSGECRPPDGMACRIRPPP